MSHSNYSPNAEKRCLWGIVLLILLYCVAAGAGLPQKATELINSAHHPETSHNEEEVSESESHLPVAPAPPEEHPDSGKPTPPPLWAVIPFVLLLGGIALLPLMPQTHHWWESNLHRFYVAGGLGLITLIYYALAHSHPVEKHFIWHGLTANPEGTTSWEVPFVVLQNAILAEYVPFIVLLFALYTICGGIRISGDLPAKPTTNAIFLLIGGTLASFIGTTGAAMVLIRPLLETNSARKHVAHTVVFFIFIVCNCGGCLLPIGDPPLFLGYLQGVPFLWTLSLWKEWVFSNGMLLLIYFLWDHFYAYPRESKADVTLDQTHVRKLTITGLMPNLPLLIGVVLAVALLDPGKPFPGTDWHPWLWLRETVQLGLVAVSLVAGSKIVREENKFNFAAIVEVAALFVGIFITMQPALQILNVHGASLGIDSATKFFWVTGGLSSVLDNAPTYLVFFKTAQALPPTDNMVGGVDAMLLTAVSLGAVFMGAMTYIGNGPNFMVKSIAEQSGIKMPSFFGYMLYSCLILLPILVLMQLLFIR